MCHIVGPYHVFHSRDSDLMEWSRPNKKKIFKKKIFKKKFQKIFLRKKISKKKFFKKKFSKKIFKKKIFKKKFSKKEKKLFTLVSRSKNGNEKHEKSWAEWLPLLLQIVQHHHIRLPVEQHSRAGVENLIPRRCHCNLLGRFFVLQILHQNLNNKQTDEWECCVWLLLTFGLDTALDWLISWIYPTETSHFRGINQSSAVIKRKSRSYRRKTSPCFKFQKNKSPTELDRRSNTAKRFRATHTAEFPLDRFPSDISGSRWPASLGKVKIS